MAYNFKSCDRDQMYLLPPDMRDWLPGNHPGWFIRETVSQLDLTAFYQRYNPRGEGRAAYHPSMMTALYFYSYCTGIRSNRMYFATVLEQALRKGAQDMLQVAIDFEVQQYIEKYQQALDERGYRLAVRNGYLPERELLTGIGPVTVRQPRVDDRRLRERDKEAEGFTSAILPRYLRRIPSIDNLIPALYLKGISTNDFPKALSAIPGEEAGGLSASTVVRLKRQWEDEYLEWTRRDLGDREYVYFWVDGIYFNVRLDDARSCILVIIATDRFGNKELLAVSDGYRESTIGWKEMLLDLKRRGIEMGPRHAVGDGAMGFWSALREVYPQTREQRCWVHKTANILDKMPRSIQSKAKAHIKEMYMAETKEDALKAYDHFVKTYKDKYSKAVNCLEKDKDVLFLPFMISRQQTGTI